MDIGDVTMIRSLFLAIAFMAAAPAVDAADYGSPMVAEPRAAYGLWRGHFSGGINVDPYQQDIVPAWNDEVAFFPDDVSCRRWIRSQKRLFPTYEGHKGCLRIR